MGRVTARVDRYLKRAIDGFRDRWYRRPFRSFGLLEALLFSRQIDFWCRASRVLRLLPARGRILDVGSGAYGLAGILKMAGWTGRYAVVSMDVKRFLPGPGTVGSAAFVPLQDRSVDAVVAMDMLEHVPSRLRGRILAEFLRVARSRVVATFPVRSRCGRFDGETADRRFQKWHLRNVGWPEGNTAEHLESEYPLLEELTRYGHSRVEPLCGNRAWLRYMKLSHLPVSGFAAGAAYWLRWKPLDALPPFHSCLMVWDIR